MYEATTRIRVRYGETDAMGYLYYGKYALFYEVGRTDLFRGLGITYKEMEASGIKMPVAEYYTKYIRPIYYDDVVTVKTLIKDWPQRRIVFHTQLFNEKEKLVNQGYVNLAFVDIKTGKPTTAPKMLLEKLEPFF